MYTYTTFMNLEKNSIAHRTLCSFLHQCCSDAYRECVLAFGHKQCSSICDLSLLWRDRHSCFGGESSTENSANIIL